MVLGNWSIIFWEEIQVFEEHYKVKNLKPKNQR